MLDSISSKKVALSVFTFSPGLSILITATSSITSIANSSKPGNISDRRKSQAATDYGQLINRGSQDLTKVDGIHEVEHDHDEVITQTQITKDRREKDIYEDIDSSDEDDDELKPEKKEAYKKTLFEWLVAADFS